MAAWQPKTFPHRQEKGGTCENTGNLLLAVNSVDHLLDKIFQAHGLL